MAEPIYIVQYREAGFEASDRTLVSVAVEANNALVAIERANERLGQLPREKKWLVHAVGPGNQPGGQTAFL